MRNSDFEARLFRDFRLRWEDTGWHFHGVVSDLSSEVHDPKLCWATLKAMKEIEFFSQVCIVAANPGNPILLVLNKKEPHGMLVKLDSKGIAALSIESARASGKDVNAFTEYEGTMLLEMSYKGTSAPNKQWWQFWK